MRIAIGLKDVRGVEIPEGEPPLTLLINKGPNLEFTHQLRWMCRDPASNPGLRRIAIYLTKTEFESLATQFKEVSQLIASVTEEKH